jgi:toxin ParE1/3/4
MGKYYLSNKAVDDLTNIWNYTSETWSEKQADKYYNNLLFYCQELAENNELGRNYFDIDNKLFGLKVDQHIIFYEILSNEEIQIHRFLHSKMDLKIRIQE